MWEAYKHIGYFSRVRTFKMKTKMGMLQVLQYRKELKNLNTKQ